MITTILKILLSIIFLPLMPIVLPIYLIAKSKNEAKERNIEKERQESKEAWRYGILPLPDTQNTINTIQEHKTDYSKSYQRSYLLTKNEYHEYKKLKAFASKYDLQICPKVRLLDLVKPRNGKGYMSALGKIQSKHVDFVITDQDLYVKGIIELDDNSHDRPERIERDEFVNQVLTSCGYKVIHTRSITESTLESIVDERKPELEQYIQQEIQIPEQKPEIKIYRPEPTYEEWKAQQEKNDHSAP